VTGPVSFMFGGLWRDGGAAVAEQSWDVVLAVVGPRANCTPDEFRAVGACLRRWLATHGYARQVYGLDDLEAGRMPSSPAAYVIQHPHRDRLLRERWSVALLAVAPDTDLDRAAEDLLTELAEVRDRLAHLTDPETYDAFTR
jgi:hypothetical protein